MTRKDIAEQSETSDTGEGFYHLEVCSVEADAPLFLSIRVRATSVENARLRAQEILGGFWEGITVLRSGDDDLTSGEMVRFYVADPSLTTHCSVEFEGES